MSWPKTTTQVEKERGGWNRFLHTVQAAKRDVALKKGRSRLVLELVKANIPCNCLCTKCEALS